MKRRKHPATTPVDTPVMGGTGGWPLYRDHVQNWAWKHEIFTPGECQDIIDMCLGIGLDKATTYSPEQSDKIRNSAVTFLYPNDVNAWIFGRMTEAIIEINNNHFGFDIFGLIEGLQFTQYVAPAQHYDWHIDRDHNFTPRKLSVSVMLSDPSTLKGGQLEMRFSRLSDKPIQFQGTGIFFPSYVLHRVAPITKGIRYSLVAWVSGPPFK